MVALPEKSEHLCDKEKLVARIWPSRNCLFATSFLFLLAVLIMPPLEVSARTGSIGTITAAIGDVTVKKPGAAEPVPASRGDNLSVGDDLITGKDSFAQVTFSDQSFANLFPSSMLRVNQYSFEPVENRRTAQVKVAAGKARFVLFKVRSLDSAFSVETNTAIVVPDMFGDFGVAASAAETRVAVFSYSAVVKNSSPIIIGEISLGINQKTIINEKMPPEQPAVVSVEERRDYMRDIRAQYRK